MHSPACFAEFLAREISVCIRSHLPFSFASASVSHSPQRIVIFFTLPSSPQRHQHCHVQTPRECQSTKLSTTPWTQELSRTPRQTCVPHGSTTRTTTTKITCNLQSTPQRDYKCSGRYRSGHQCIHGRLCELCGLQKSTLQKWFHKHCRGNQDGKSSVSLVRSSDFSWLDAHLATRWL